MTYRLPSRYDRLIPPALVLILLMAQRLVFADGPATTQSSISLFPAAGAEKICPDTPLRLTFPTPPSIGTGQIKLFDAADNSLLQSIDVARPTATQSIGGAPHFNYYPIILSGNNATLYLPNGSLAYGKTYYLTLDAGAFKTASGAFAGITDSTVWRFTTKPAAPSPAAGRLTIAADGSGDFCTVQGALDALPKQNTQPITLFLRKGVYTELIHFRQKQHITITGEDPVQTIIEYSNNARFNPSSEQGYHRGVFFAAKCDDLVVSNLTIRNTTPRGGSQAETIILNGNAASKAILANLNLFSFQDTLQINGQAYISHCYIEGDVDFMWGRGPCFFESCHCFSTRSKAFYAQVRNPKTNHGFVYHRCIFDGPPGITDMYLNRIAPAVYPHSEMVLIDCQLGPAVGSAGWLLDVPKGATVPTTEPDIHFWEFNSHDAGGKPIDTSKRIAVSRQLTSPADDDLIQKYSTPSFVLGNGWDPARGSN